jgi:hypothetical protein
MTTTTLGAPAEWLLPLTLRRELIEQGFNDRALARMIRDGTLAKVRWGAYAAGPAHRVLDELGRHALTSRAVLMQSRSDASLSHSSALPWFGAPRFGLDLRTVDITRHDGRAGRREAGVRQHCGGLEAGDLVERAGISLVTPARAAVEFTTVAGIEAGLVQVNHLLHSGQTTPTELAVMQRRFDRWPGSLSTDIVLRLADARLESVLESRFFYMCYRHSVPLPTPQYVIENDAGDIVARLDFAWPALRKWAETDGNVKYEKLLRSGERASDAVLREKRRESMVSKMTGWDCMRFDNDDLRWPHHTAERLKQFLAE